MNNKKNIYIYKILKIKKNKQTNKHCIYLNLFPVHFYFTADLNNHIWLKFNLPNGFTCPHFRII